MTADFYEPEPEPIPDDRGNLPPSFIIKAKRRATALLPGQRRVTITDAGVYQRKGVRGRPTGIWYMDLAVVSDDGVAERFHLLIACPTDPLAALHDAAVFEQLEDIAGRTFHSPYFMAPRMKGLRFLATLAYPPPRSSKPPHLMLVAAEPIPGVSNASAP